MSLTAMTRAEREAFLESTRDTYAAEENVLVRGRVEHRLSVDYAKQYAPGG